MDVPNLLDLAETYEQRGVELAQKGAAAPENGPPVHDTIVEAAASFIICKALRKLAGE